MALGERLKQLREKAGYSQRDLAKLLNIGSSTLAMYEVNRRQPDYDTLRIFASFFNVSTDYLLGVVDTPQPSKLKFDPDAPLHEKSLADALLKVSEMAYQFDLDDETASLLIKKAFDRFGPPKPIIKEGEAASGPRYPGTGALDKHKKKEDD
jgi:transcriptional regulator with XRE-family HTH domain